MMPSQAMSDGPPQVGDTFLDLVLPLPSDSFSLAYLGLEKSKAEFSISEIKTEVLIIEIFSMYCPHCQREAPTINDLYQKIESTKNTQGKVKLIGIGAGNSAFEVEFFKKKYDIRFPLFPDGDFKIHSLLGEVRTPYFFGLKIDHGKPIEVFFSKLGGAKDAKMLLDELMSQTEF